MPDEVARIGALSNGSNGQRSLESASLHFEPIFRREGGVADREPAGEILSASEGSALRSHFVAVAAKNYVFFDCQGVVANFRYAIIDLSP
jgi:hypothetical protein